MDGAVVVNIDLRAGFSDDLLDHGEMCIRDRVYPADGTSCVPDGCAALKGAPHPDNAKLFLDFAVSYDVQQLLQSDFYRRPVRSDVSPASKLPELSAIRQVAYDVSWASEHREAILMSWAFYLGTEAEQ